MRLFRYRKPSWKTVLGVTKAKKRIKRELGITAAMKPFRWWTNQKRRVKRRVGYESELGRIFRHGARTPGGCAVAIATIAAALTLLAAGIGYVLAG